MAMQTYKKSTDDWSSNDRQMMSLALQLAKKGEFTARPNPMVGCVITLANKIVAQGWHQKSGQAHAEINALKQAGEKSQGATCYVTLEPCAHTGKTGPCAKALIEAGVSKVIAAMLDPNPQVAGKGFQMLIDAGIEVEYGLLQEQAQILNRGFMARFNKKRPWITCKLAMSLDGRTALADGSSKWITGAAARNDVQKLRARQDAIITGIGTLKADNPSLNVRANEEWFVAAKETGFSQPARILLDRNNQAKISAKLFAQDANVYWITEHEQDQEHDRLDGNALEKHINLLTGFSSLEVLLKYFAESGMNNLLLEAGHKLAGEFLRQGLIDELIVYMAPKLMGTNAMGLFELDVQLMTDTPLLKLKDCRQLGDDIRLTYQFES